MIAYNYITIIFACSFEAFKFLEAWQRGKILAAENFAFIRSAREYLAKRSLVSRRNSVLDYMIGGIMAAFFMAYKGKADTVIWQVWVGANPPDDCRAIRWVMKDFCSCSRGLYLVRLYQWFEIIRTLEPIL